MKQINYRVRKRNGSIVPFDQTRITNAMKKAFIACRRFEDTEDSNAYLEHLSDIVTETMFSRYDHMDQDDESVMTILLDIESIQDTVEEVLQQSGNTDIAKEYILYRQERKEIRDFKNTTDSAVLKLLSGTNKELAEENSNKDTRLNSTQRDYVAGIVSKDIAKRLLLPKDLVAAHENGIIHIHDMDYIMQAMFNCCLVNIGDMLDNGFVMNGKLIESPKSFKVACTVTTQIIANIASNQYGGQSVEMRHLGKYLRRSYEKHLKRYKERNPGCSEEDAIRNAKYLTHDELVDGVQTLQYQINTLMTTNGQSPFVTLFLILRDDDEYIEENAAIIQEILKQRLQGIKNDAGVYITPAFPKLVYVLDENNMYDGKYAYLTKLAARCSAKRMYPDYISAKRMRENYEGNVFSPMGCRSFLAPWKDENGNYKFEGRFNQGVVSLNLPQIGLIARGDENTFWKLMDERLELCFKALMFRHEALRKVTSDVSPLHWQYGGLARLPKHASIEPLLYGGYSSISLGYIGVYETVMAMKGVSHTTPEGKEFALRIVKHLSDTCKKWKAETNIGFALYGTPAESLCYRFAEIDKEKFGVVENITDKGYYTNSYHVDVREHIDAFSKLSFENEFQNLSTGGCISYVEVPDMQHNVEALETMIKFIYENIQYAEFNCKSDYCQVCGFDGEIKVNKDGVWECPCCHNTDQSKMNVVRRTCGYLGEKYWNVGKTKEIASRVTHL